MAATTIVIGCRDTGRVEALTRAIAASNELNVASAWPAERAVATGMESDTALVVLDGYPSGAALRGVADVTGARPDLGVLILGPVKSNLDVLVALASGAFGYLPSASTPAVVADAVTTMLGGDMVLPRAVWHPLVRLLQSAGRGIVVTGPGGRDAELTNRQWEVLVQLRQARSTAEIARRIVVSRGTVRTHVSALMRKLDARNRGALTGPADCDEGWDA